MTGGGGRAERGPAWAGVSAAAVVVCLGFFAFTTGRLSDPIRIAPASVAIAQASCGRCHAEIADSMGHGGVPREERDCLDCHVGTGHSDSGSTF